MTERICIGAVTGSYGVRGDVRLKSFCADPAAMGDYGLLSTEDGGRNFTLTLGHAIKNGFTGRLSGVTSKEAADALRGTRLYAPRDALPDLPDDEFYHADLIGLLVLDTGGGERGIVHAVHNHGASDLLEVRPKGGTGTVLVPFTRDIVPTVDLTVGRLIVDPPEGLFDDTDEAEDA